jgi:PAS domain S-box-containing protein
MSFDMPETSEQPGYRTATLLAFVAAPVLVLLSALLLFTALRSADNSQRQVERSYQTREQILRVFSLLQDAETGQRGFVITGQDNFLEPYNTALPRLNSQFAVLDRLFAAEPAQRQRLSALRQQSELKIAVMEQSISVRREAGAQAAIAQVSSERGKNAMDAVRGTIDQMVGYESDALNARLDEARAATMRVQLLAGGVILLLFASLIAAGALVRRHNRARQRLIEAIQQYSARQEAVFDSTQDGMITLNPSGSIESVNRAAERMFGWTRHELSRRDVSLLMEIAPGEGTFLRRLAEEGTTGRAREIVAKRRDGATFEAEVALGSMKLRDGEHLVAAVRDVTDRKQAERLKEEFVSTVSHELRTPLTSIAGALGLMESGAAGALPEKANRLVYIAKTSSERLVRLINDLLDVEKIASGQVHFDLQPLDATTAARRAVEGVNALAAERQVVIRLEAPSEPLMVRGDMDRLIQVFTNLLSNAVKFSPDGETVDFVLVSRDRRVRVIVRDRGPGVPESFRGNIFGKFAQADSSSARAKSGTGLGLAISKEIVERHHGRIRLVSPPSEGAVFEVELPQITETAPAVRGARRLLICEDDPHAAEILADLLEREGFSAHRVSTIAEAEAALHENSFSALVLDLNLPDGDGLSLIQRLRAMPDFASLPVVVVTGESRGPEALSGVLPIVDWIQKPVDPARLSQAVRTALPGRNDLCILHVDDDRDLTEIVAATLSGTGEIHTAATQAEARKLILGQRFDLIVLDVGLPDGSGLDLLGDIGAADPRPSVIVYSGQEIEPELLGRVDAVLTKSRTSFETLVETVRKLTTSEASR